MDFKLKHWQKTITSLEIVFLIKIKKIRTHTHIEDFIGQNFRKSYSNPKYIHLKGREIWAQQVGCY